MSWKKSPLTPQRQSKISFPKLKPFNSLNSKPFLFLFFLCIISPLGVRELFAQDVFLKVSAYKSGIEYKFYADNPHPCPVQMQVTFPHIFEITYKHKAYPVEDYLYTIIPPNEKEYHCFSIKLADTTLKKFMYSYHAYLGLPATKVDSSFLYVLPYEIGTKHFGGGVSRAFSSLG